MITVKETSIFQNPGYKTAALLTWNNCFTFVGDFKSETYIGGRGEYNDARCVGFR